MGWDRQRNTVALRKGKEELELWSPNRPYLYRLRVKIVYVSSKTEVDVIERNIGLRTVEFRLNQLFINDEYTFLHGVLHQGYWPEGLLGPPNVQALEDDVRSMKAAGFNTVRVHMTVFPAPFYAACDKYGLLVIQDMPSGDGRVIPAWDMHRRGNQPNMEDNRGFDEIVQSSDARNNFLAELRAMVTGLRPFASVIIWTLFNEGWGQSETLETIHYTRKWDPTRLINAVSGWNDPLLFGEPYPVVMFEEDRVKQLPTRFSVDIGDFFDFHNYEGSEKQNLSNTFEIYPFPLANRPVLVGEYGGIGYSLSPRHEYDADASWGYGNVRQSNRGFREAFAAVLDRVRMLFCWKQWEGKERDNGSIPPPRTLEDFENDPFAIAYREVIEKQNRTSPLGENKYNIIGSIYTQWSDVETEINGVLSYDRVPKMPLSVMKEMGDNLLNDYYTKCARKRS